MGTNNNQISTGNNYDLDTHYDDFRIESTEIALKKNYDSANLEPVVENRQEDRRDPELRHRTALDKSVLHHLIGNNHLGVDRNDPNRLEHLSDASNLISAFKEHDLLIHEGRAWITTLKHDPFSGKDLMIVSKDSKITNIGNLKSYKVLGEFFQILQRLVTGITDENSGIFNPDIEELIIGNNVTIKPLAGEAQSLPPPHIHVTVYSIVEGFANNVETIFDTLGNHKNVFPLNKINLLLIGFLETHLNNKGIKTKRELGLDNHDFLALEIKLGDNNFGDCDYIFHIYQEINRFNKTIKSFNGLLKGADSEYEHNRLSYSVSFKYDDGKIVMRVRYSYRNKEKGERGGAGANFGHMNSRIDGLPYPDTKPFKEAVEKICMN